MTDEQIIKALECCIDEMGCTKGCPCFDPKAKGSHCTVSKKLELEKLTLDLIKRQKAEVEFLKQDALTPDVIKIGDEVARREKIKAEAIKEFAERAKEKLCDIGRFEYCGGYYYLIGVAFFDNLVKEMVGDNK